MSRLARTRESVLIGTQPYSFPRAYLSRNELPAGAGTEVAAAGGAACA
jgi:hypothetical protein